MLHIGRDFFNRSVMMGSDNKEIAYEIVDYSNNSIAIFRSLIYAESYLQEDMGFSIRVIYFTWPKV